MLNNKWFSSRWAVFVVGMVLGWALLAACAAATATPVEEEPAAEEPAAEEPAAEEPAAEEPAAEEPAAEEPAAEEPAAQEGGSTLDAVISAGVLKCGVNGSLPGFGAIDADGNNVGFDVDFCKAVAAAVLGDANAVEYTTLNADQRFPALQTGEVDVLIRNTTWTTTRDTDLGLDFTTVTFYDGQGYMVRADDGFETVEDLDGGTICVTSGTTTELNLADNFDFLGLSYTPNVFSETADTHQTFVDGACDAETSDKSQLAGLRSAEANPEDYVILAATISKEPLGPVVRANDSAWRDVVTWTAFAMFEADERGINQANVDDADPDNPFHVALLGLGDSNLGALLGLNQDWAYQVISQVGSYDDVFQRHLTPIGISRDGSANASWVEGGLLYSPPFK